MFLGKRYNINFEFSKGIGGFPGMAQSVRYVPELPLYILIAPKKYKRNINITDSEQM